MDMSKVNKTGRIEYEHGTYVTRRLMSSEAWAATSPKAQILYIWLGFEWKGSKFNNNGKIRLSCRQAARRIGIGANAAMRAFHELQAKGFIVVTPLGALGIEGEARGTGPRMVRFGRLVRYRVRDIEDWIEANTTPDEPN